MSMSSHAFTRTAVLSEKITIQVPTMGDSITEGTIVEWTAQVGQAVKVDDVVALIETDKVTIDIKAQADGVIMEHFAAVDQEVEVGANLYQIDTEAEATGVGVSVSVSVSEEAVDTDAASAASASEAMSASASTGVRIPSIKFLGKDGWKSRLSVAGEATTPSPSVTAPMKANASIVREGGALSPMYGRLLFSEREMEDLMLGGASEAPYNY